MLKKIIIFFFFGFLALNNQAQNFGGGIILGINTSQVGGDDLGGFNKAGLLIGIFANNNISEYLSFKMEMTYTQKGSNNPKMNDDSHPNYLRQDISLSYVEIPLVLQYHQSNKLNIETGILSGYLIDGYYNDISGEMYNATNPFVNYDIGMLIGMDYKYSKNIRLNTRISNSILPIGAEDYDKQFNSLSKGKYNSVLSFALHYNF